MIAVVDRVVILGPGMFHDPKTDLPGVHKIWRVIHASASNGERHKFVHNGGCEETLVDINPDAGAGRGGPPGGVLSVWLSPDDDDGQNWELGQQLRDAKEHIDVHHWGVTIMRVSAEATTVDGVLRHTGNPTHADLLALEHLASPIGPKLPALALFSPRKGTRVGILDASELAAEGFRLGEWLAEKPTWQERAPEVAAREERASQWYNKKREESGDGLSGGAAGTARKLRTLGIRALLVEPEGTMKKQLNKRVLPTAAAAAAKRQAGSYKSCYFDRGLVPLLRALLVLPDGAKDEYNPYAFDFVPAAAAELRADAPALALLTDLGRLVPDPRSAQQWDSDERVHEVLANLVHRIGSELGLPLPEEVAPALPPPPGKRMTRQCRCGSSLVVNTYVDFSGKGGCEWTKPRPDMIRAALDDLGLADTPRAALMVGHDHRDRQMAQRAGVRYIHAGHLRAGCLDRIVEPNEEYEPRAPQTFNPPGKFGTATHGVNPDGRADLAGQDYMAAKADMPAMGASSAQAGRGIVAA